MLARVSLVALVILVAGLAGPTPAHSQEAVPSGGEIRVVRGDTELFWWQLEEGQVPSIALVAHSPVNPAAPKPQDPCHLDIEWRRDEVSFRLTAILTGGGLPAVFEEVPETQAERDFDVGQAELRGEPWEDEGRHLDTFFATLDLGPSEERRMDVRTIPGSGTFRSNGAGQVRVVHFDGSFIWLAVQAPMIENIGERFEPRLVTVEGWLQLHLPDATLGPGHIFQLMGDVMGRGETGKGLTIYMCGNRAEVQQAAADAGIQPRLKGPSGG